MHVDTRETLLIMLALFVLVLVFILSPCQAINESITNSSATNLVTDEESKLETYIVFLKKPEGIQLTESKDFDRWHRSFLPASTFNLGEDRLLYSYSSLVTGFAAKLTSEEVKQMEEREGFVSAHREKVLQIHTTHTPSFLGLQQNSGIWSLSGYGKGMIIAVLDTGVAPGHPSFSDENMSSPPAKWKGKCEFKDTACNKKIIGARYFKASGDLPYDDNGHGTHTAATAAGSPVKGANYYGELDGTASGIAPLAHLAIYKVCNQDGDCPESDVLAGIEAAVEDGADVLSLSLGYRKSNFSSDPIAIGAFGAAEKGVFVSTSAGNEGPHNQTIRNEAPWLLTVGASTVDRSVRATVKLGNNAQLDGQSLFQPSDFLPVQLPLVYAGANGNESSKYCHPDSLNDVDVKGKVVLCEMEKQTRGISKGQVVKDAGGSAMILMNDQLTGNYTQASLHVLPASHVGYADGLLVKAYINSTSSSTATILFKRTVYGMPYAPQATVFTSRGPSRASPGILKPDILGPGYKILAAWPFSLDNFDDPSPTNYNFSFNAISGTSMSCPHLSGIAAILKSIHPDWSPAAIKSAIMTTAYSRNLGGTPITDQYFAPVDVFAIGSGHVDPSKANDPGLVYDTSPDDYIPYLCGLGHYTDKDILIITQRNVKCSNITSIPEAQLNYPSFSVRLGSSPQTYKRTVTNFGPAQSTYVHKIMAPQGVNIVVEPEELSFSKVNQKATYSVTFTRETNSSSNRVSTAEGYLSWVSDQHIVRSPIAIIFN